MTAIRFWDHEVYDWLRAVIGDGNAKFWLQLFSIPWFYLPVFVFIALLFILWNSERGRGLWLVFFSLSTWVLAGQIAWILSRILREPAPYIFDLYAAGRMHELDDGPFHYSLPDSSMACMTAMLFFSMRFMIHLGRPWRILISAILIPFAIGRMSAGQAFPTHVLLGLVTGIVVGLLMVIFWNNFRRVILDDFKETS